jgi:hypothetical protein
MPAHDKRETGDPSSRKLPPVRNEPKSAWLPKIPMEGVNSKLKVFVIGLTFVTIAAFGIFIAMFVKKAFVKGADNTAWGPQLLTIAEELKDKGLQPQAIEHYQKYLDSQKVNLETRSRISFEIATLYVQLGQCDDAVVWFLHAKAAQPEEHRIQKSNTQIQQCRSRSKTSQ